MATSSAQIFAFAKRCIQSEIAALELLPDALSEDFAQCIRLLLEQPRRVVCSGIGKSAFIAQKIAATFNSTGQPAVFLHAADAIHGDLGIVQPNDLVLCISKSGNTPEIKVLAPLVKHLGHTLVAIVSNRDSYLAQQADLVLYAPVPQEGDPNNLAPTASTTAQMALGDALAVALLGMRGFSAADFAKLHPGGALGKQLFLRVGDVYPHLGKPTVYASTPIKEVIIEITKQRLGCAVVIDNLERVIGFITDGDLRRALEQNVDLATATAATILSPQPQTIHPDEMAVAALRIMEDRSITQLIVAENNHYLGVIHLHEILREGIL